MGPSSEPQAMHTKYQHINKESYHWICQNAIHMSIMVPGEIKSLSDKRQNVFLLCAEVALTNSGQR